jgi:hypothetical protein
MTTSTGTRAQTTTITQMLDAAPDVDVRDTWEALYGTLTDIKDRLTAEFEVVRHPSTEGRDYYTAGQFEGSLTAYSGPRVEWLVHSWIGNRSASILDMNINVWLDATVDAPHLCLVFGTVPHLFHYSDLIARRDLAADPEHLARYYEPENPHWLRFRGDERFTWSVSHGTYMRAVASPVAHSYTAERTPENVAAVQQYAEERFERWLELVRSAPAVPEHERPALAARDHQVRRLTYALDPMNALAERAMGVETARQLVELRTGSAQIAEAEAAG